ncbi:hypothetical protein [Microvirga calopogonii]|uniref:hypothetical protein n=1 Tax=Microvirga calopogonii TaxID=2078013 RepID=UPI0013B3F725|nr:hypothetical protein [Microvirga calopogonii]
MTNFPILSDADLALVSGGGAVKVKLSPSTQRYLNLVNSGVQDVLRPAPNYQEIFNGTTKGVPPIDLNDAGKKIKKN